MPSNPLVAALSLILCFLLPNGLFNRIIYKCDVFTASWRDISAFPALWASMTKLSKKCPRTCRNDTVSLSPETNLIGLGATSDTTREFSRDQIPWTCVKEQVWSVPSPAPSCPDPSKFLKNLAFRSPKSANTTPFWNLDSLFMSTQDSKSWSTSKIERLRTYRPPNIPTAANYTDSLRTSIGSTMETLAG